LSSHSQSISWILGHFFQRFFKEFLTQGHTCVSVYLGFWGYGTAFFTTTTTTTTTTPKRSDILQKFSLLLIVHGLHHGRDLLNFGRMGSNGSSGSCTTPSRSGDKLFLRLSNQSIQIRGF